VGTGHIHDFNPGIASSGLFWTTPIPPDSVQLDFGQVQARMALQNLALEDTIPSPPVPATVSMVITWSGLTAELDVRDLVHQFAGHYRECSATCQWSASEAGFSFVSTATTQTRFAELGMERNGKFFQ
jgi:hypothetical protein